jgi:two-component system sensor kinase FixL
VKFEMAAGKAWARVDPDRLKQVFLNLFSNAREAGATRVSVAFEEAPGLRRARVLDNGKGLGAEPEKLFRPFFTTRPKGTGLGLSIARAVAQAHGGRLYAEPRPRGRGACFILEIPREGT